jgi:hypothetical protein
MNIVKQFEDNEILGVVGFYRNDDFYANPGKYTQFYWGLGDDSELYFKSLALAEDDKWHWCGEEMSVDWFPPLKSICRIAKEFGHLMVWL